MNKKIKNTILIISVFLVMCFSYVYINYKFRVGIETKTFLYIKFSKKENKFIKDLNFEEKYYFGNTYDYPDLDFYIGGE